MGRGGPEKEAWWIGKRERAIERRTARLGALEETDELAVEEVGGWLSDDDEEKETETDTLDEREEEWRRVRPLGMLPNPKIKYLNILQSS